MDALQKGTFTLIKAALTGKACVLPEDFQLAEVVEMINLHKIAGLAYEGAIKCGIDRQCEAMQKLFQAYYLGIIRNERQMAQLKKLEAAFQENGIDYLPLKGTILKPLYPQPATRVMGDADILIREEQCDKIKPVLEQLGFQEGPQSDHELHWNHPSLHLELHRWLVPKKSIDLYRYYENGWSKAIPYSGSRYTYREEDHYIYMFIHYAKHYRGGGIGLRQLIDLWIYQRVNPNMDIDYIRTELSKLKLVTFFENTRNMLAAWFDGGVLDAKIDHMTNFIWNSGSWGSREAHQIADGIKEAKAMGSQSKSRLLYIIKSIFPPVSKLKLRYPFLEKVPILLPLMWPVRWISALLFRKKNINNYVKIVNNRTSKKADPYMEALQYVGLDYDF